MKQLKSDKSQMVLTGDKGVVLVVIDTVDYIRKAKDILEDTNTFTFIIKLAIVPSQEKSYPRCCTYDKTY